MFSHSNNRVAVVASAQTQLRTAWHDRQHVDLISEAVVGVLKGSGLRLEDVDFIIDAGSDILDGRSISNCGFLGAMGAHHKEESRVEEDGLWAALYAATKIASGSAEVGLVVAYSKPSESDVSAFYSTQCEPFFQRPVGFDHVAASGIQAQLYLDQTDATESSFAHVVAHDWANAVANPWVATDGAPTVDEIRSSDLLATPLRKLDFSRQVDGAVAVLVTSQRVAAKMDVDPVWITGIGTAMDQHAFALRDHAALPACEVAARTAYGRAGMSDPKRASLVETGAGSVAGELMVLEALGLADRGHGADLFVDGSDIALNPSGGSLPADPIMATGLVRLSEAALQLTGRVDHAPPDATSAIVHGAGGIGLQNHCVFTLEV
jgi:acetyl-CoA C-acetyltransferase